MKVFNLTFEELDKLHQATDCAYFKHDEKTGKVYANALTGDYIFGVGKFTSRFPDVDIKGLKVIDYVAPKEVTL